ncbi:MAG: hypothetical protein JNK87_03805 [Bryobacterales bacterium]|nr:hypothetical protein [Bryobacterales bacterium]
MKFAVLLLCFAAFELPAPAQTLSLGVKGGGFFTDPAERQDQSRKYVVGPSVEVGFGRIGVEANVLYWRFGSAVSGVRVRGHVMELPVLGKYYFAGRNAVVRPFAGAGFAFRNVWTDDGRGRFGNREVASTEPGVGAVFGGGVAMKVWKLRLSPEVRYTRWGGYNFPVTNANQVQALLGVTF